MLFTEADLQTMLRAIGTDVLIGATPAVADFRSKARDVTLYGTTVESLGPTCRVTAGMVAALGIDHGTLITVSGIVYTVVGLAEETGGFVNLSLTLET